MTNSQVIVLTNDNDGTVDRVIETISVQYPATNVVRLNFEHMLTPGAIRWSLGSPEGRSGQLTVTRGSIDRRIDLEQPFAVWYRRPTWLVIDNEDIPYHERRFISAETQELVSGGLLHPTFSRWVNEPTAESRASNKLIQLVEAERAGLRIPATLVTSDPIEARSFYKRHEDSGIVTKTASPPSVVADSSTFIYTSEIESIEELDGVAHCPTLLQKRVTKLLELRVTWVLGEAFVAGIDSSGSPEASLDFRRDYPSLKYVHHDLEQETLTCLAKLMDSLGLAFGAIDLILDPTGEIFFLEVNPSGQYGWLEEALSLPISESIARTLVRFGQGRDLAHI